MKRIYLLKPYQDHGADEVITVSNNVAFGLIDSGIARKAVTRDFLVKPEFGTSKAIDTKKIARSRRRVR